MIHMIGFHSKKCLSSGVMLIGMGVWLARGASGVGWLSCLQGAWLIVNVRRDIEGWV